MADPIETAEFPGAEPSADRNDHPKTPSVAMDSSSSVQPGGPADASEALSQTASGEFAWAEASLSATAPLADQGKSVAWPRLARLDYVPEQMAPAAGPKSAGNPFQLWMWIAAQVCGFGLLLGGYLLGQAWAPRARPGVTRNDATKTADTAPRSVRAGSERALDAANHALTAERSHDFQAARDIYEEMAKRQTPLAGAEYRLALISLHEGDFLQTEAHLNRSLRLEEAMADCYLLRASLAGMKSNFADASTQFAAAVRSQPFNAKLLFCWGEALRRDGRLPEALQRLGQALDRPDNSVARELYLFKWRLAKLEAGSDVVFNAELARHLAEPAPGGDWLLLAAAQEIDRRNEAAAAAHIGRAKGLLPRELLATYLQDYLFQSRRIHPELAVILNEPPPSVPQATDSPLEDPAVWTAAEADPAAWPPFPPVD